MSRKFQYRVIPSTWLESNGRRLDCGPYMSGAVEAKELLKSHTTETLKTLTVGHNGGIFNGPRFPRVYVDDPSYGVPFLGSTDILNADFSNVSLLSKKQVDDNPALVLNEGWSLITCSGTIGRMAYSRPGMKGMAGSQHFMRVTPDASKIAPGYLYAYLSSRFGVPLIVSGTYGAIIQHIEPHHIADLPVPRLGTVEDQAHELIQKAADNRDEASRLVEEAIELLHSSTGIPDLDLRDLNGIPFGVIEVSSSAVLERLDGSFHSQFHREVLDALNSASVPMTAVSSFAHSVVEPKRFKRIQIKDPNYGISLFGTSALMWADPIPSYLIPRTMNGIDELIVNQKTVLIPRSGQIAGIIGTAILPYGALIGGAVSEDAIRVHCKTEIDAGFIFIALRSQYGYRQLKARAYGSSIPHLDVTQVGSVQIPNLADDLVEKIGSLGLRSAQLRHEAILNEQEARSLVERTIEGGGR